MVVSDIYRSFILSNSDSKVHGANMGPTWVLSAPDGPHVGHMNFAIRDTMFTKYCLSQWISDIYWYNDDQTDVTWVYEKSIE